MFVRASVRAFSVCFCACVTPARFPLRRYVPILAFGSIFAAVGLGWYKGRNTLRPAVSNDKMIIANQFTGCVLVGACLTISPSRATRTY